MRTRTVFFLLLSLFAASGCASRDDMQYLQHDLNEVNTRLSKMEKDISSIRVETREGTESTLKGLQKDLENMSKTLADLQAAQDINRVDILSLSGKIDDARQLAMKPSEEMTLLKEDFDRRLTTLEGKVADTGKTPTEKKQVTPESLYQSGLDAFKSNDMQRTRDIFTQFTEHHPKNVLASNAHFWIGETYFIQKNYEQAILEYQEVIKKYPGKEKVPAAMLKQAMSFKELGDDKSARYIYKKLIEEHPRSEEAKRAKDKLKGMK